ncbi:MAG: protoglobin domain-containing protein [Candidatus Binatia bacterium]
MPTLLELTGLDADERERRMQFIGFGEADRERLAREATFFESIADGMAEVFYDHLLSFPQTARFLEDPVLVTRLKASQRRHFIELCTGPYGEAYFESRLRVGVAHARIRLDPHLYLGGYLIQINYVRARFEEKFRDDPAAAQACTDSIIKIIMLDIALATDAYIYGGFVERTTADTRAYEAALAQEALETKLREEEKREELLRMIMHDIRSPVAAMMATARASMRRYRDLGEPPGKQFALVEATGANVLQIIDNMVSHARAPGGELPLACEPFDVSEVVSACVAQLRPFAQQTAHALSVVTLLPAPSTRLDKVLVRRVVSNLLVNACRHTPAGCVIEVECRPDGEYCRIVVADDGPGISSAIREAFAIADLKPKADGGAFVDSGLGLPFCRMACDRMGGSLELEPSAGRGTRFVVLLPL